MVAAAVEGFAAGARQGDDLTAVVVRELGAMGGHVPTEVQGTGTRG